MGEILKDSESSERGSEFSRYR